MFFSQTNVDFEKIVFCSTFDTIQILDGVLEEESPDLKIIYPNYEFNGKIIPLDYLIGNIGDGKSDLVINACQAENTFARVQNIKILHRNVKQCNENAILGGNPRFLCTIFSLF